MTEPSASGPLDGVKVLELGGIGPGPFATMLLADLGADVVRVERPDDVRLYPGRPEQNLVHRGKRSVLLNLRDEDGLRTGRALAAQADIVVEGFRPGTVERLGIGPDDLWADNPALVYGRVTGWGQSGPRAMTAGHDINYISITGALHAIGPAGGPPQIPVSFLGDAGGGGMYLVVGVLAALREASVTGRGQVVDAAITDGVAHLMTATHARLAAGAWIDERGVNLIDGGAPFYAVYSTSDSRHMAVGCLESKFYAEFVALMELDVDLSTQNDRSTWPDLRRLIGERFASRAQIEWIELFHGSDACVSPVLSLRSAAEEPQIVGRASLGVAHGALQAGRAPRFSSHPGWSPRPVPSIGEHTELVVADWLADRAIEG